MNVSIQNVERIPIAQLNFTIFNNNNDAEVANVSFYVSGTEILDTNSRFTVTLVSPSIVSEYTYGYGYDITNGYRWDYDKGYGYGYGYGNSSLDNITLSYTIVYTTHTTGTFYGKLFVNASLNSIARTYTSSATSTFTVTAPSSGGGSGGGGGATPEEEQETSEGTMNDIEEQYGVTLEVPFYANDTDGDGIVDTFTDPNDVLTCIHNTTVAGNASFLISVDDDEIPEFLWDAEADTVTPVTHNVGDIVDTEIDTEDNTITVTITIEKANWTYIEVSDDYPEFNVTIKTADGRIISSDMIWRENNKIYVLDDPATEYHLIYDYEEAFFLFDVVLELIPTSAYAGENINALIELTNVGEPGLVNATINYTLYKGDEVIWSEEEDLSILGQLAFNKTISTTGLSSGNYTFKVVHYYGDDQTASAQVMFTVNAQPQPPAEEIPLWILILLVVILIIILIIVYLFKIGYLRI